MRNSGSLGQKTNLDQIFFGENGSGIKISAPDREPVRRDKLGLGFLDSSRAHFHSKLRPNFFMSPETILRRDRKKTDHASSQSNQTTRRQEIGQERTIFFSNATKYHRFFSAGTREAAKPSGQRRGRRMINAPNF